MIEVGKAVLGNGLRIVHAHVRSTQMVAVNTLYNVGSKNEECGHTGLAHLLEHLMFGGSEHVSDFDGQAQLAYGENNAWTNDDFTNYYLTVPKENVETALWMESDRMRGLDLNENTFRTQQHVVCEEFKQRILNRPYGDAQHLVRKLCYKKHPYAWPTIGKNLSQIERMTLADAKSFYDAFYVPGNAIVAIVGNIDCDKAMALAEKWFGGIPACPAAGVGIPREGRQMKPRLLRAHRNVPFDAIYMAFHMCGRTDPDYYVFDMISDILSNGKSSRLLLDLVRKKQLFSSVDAYISGSVHPGLLQISGKINEHVDFEMAENAIWNELSRLQDLRVDEQELEKIKNKFESDFVFSNLNYVNLASNLAMYEAMGGAERINEEVDRYRRVSAEDVRRVARLFLSPSNCSVVRYEAVRK